MRRKLTMVTDTGGVNDQSFNQSAWEGMTELYTRTVGMSATLSPSRIPITQPILIRLLTHESDLFGALLCYGGRRATLGLKDNPTPILSLTTQRV